MFALVLLLLAGLFSGLTVPAQAAPPAVPAAAGPSPAARAAAACADVLVVGVNGGGESPTQPGSFGPTLTRFATVYDAALTRSVAVKPISAKFAGPGTLLTQTGASVPARSAVSAPKLRQWQSGIGVAADAVFQAVAAAARACPEQVFVLAGYAQGASAVHRALIRLQGAGYTPRLGGVALISDPDRAKATRGVVIGQPAAPRFREGIAAAIGASVADVPAQGSGVLVHQVCSKSDLVCDLSGDPLGTARAVQASYGAGAGRPALDAAAKAIADRTRLWAVANPRAATLVFEAKQPVAGFLHVDVALEKRDMVRWVGISGLPEGIRLSDRGVLTGSTTATGRWTVRFTTHNTALSPQRTRATSGTLTLVIRAAAAITSGGQTACEVRGNGTAWCWGDNSYGQLGNGTKTASPTPVQVGTATDWRSVSAGGSTTCGIKTGGGLYCWGMNHRGQLGIGQTSSAVLTPTKVGSATWAEVANSWLHTCGVQTDRSLWCWGQGGAGQLGNGTTAARANPVRVGTLNDWTSVAVGGWHSCATRMSGATACWGNNRFGQLGLGNTTSTRSPVTVPNNAFVSVTASWTGTCGLTLSGQVKCWGDNAQGQVGDGTLTQRNSPAGVAGTYSDVTSGSGYTCATAAAGQMLCWGSNRYGQYGTGQAPSKVPARVDVGGQVRTVDAGWFTTCFTYFNGATRCVGENQRGQLGTGSTTVPRPAHNATGQSQAGGMTVTTFNLLGSQHSVPGGGSADAAPGRARIDWAADLTSSYRSDIAAFQEIQLDQFRMLRLLRPEYAAYPGTTAGPKGVWVTIFWDQRRWTAQQQGTFEIPFRGKTRPVAWVVLRHKASGRDVYVLNVHNSAVQTKAGEAERDRAAALEIAAVKEWRAKKMPVILLGDFNEHDEIFCKVTTQTDLFATQGGSRGTPCNPPKKKRVDWIFVSAGAQVDRHTFDNGSRVQITTDHTVITARLRIPGLTE